MGVILSKGNEVVTWPITPQLCLHSNASHMENDMLLIDMQYWYLSCDNVFLLALYRR